EEDGGVELHHQLVALALDLGALDVLERLLLLVHVVADDGARAGADARTDGRADRGALATAGQRADAGAQQRTTTSADGSAGPGLGGARGGDEPDRADRGNQLEFANGHDGLL